MPGCPNRSKTSASSFADTKIMSIDNGIFAGPFVLSRIRAGWIDASNSASSPPREVPRTPMRDASTDGCAASQSSAVPKYSSGIFVSDRGNPSTPKYASDSTA